MTNSPDHQFINIYHQYTLSALIQVCRVTEGNTVTTSHEFQELFKILLGQDLDQRFARTLAGRVVFGAWLVFALVIGSAYRGNLTASLTLPVLPSRPETLREIVEAADG